MTGTRAVIAAWGVLLLGVTACSGSDPEPHVAAPSSSAPSSPSTSPAAADLGPEATVAAWIAAQNEALKSGDTSRIRELSREPCEACEQFIDPIERVYAEGGRFETEGWVLNGSHLRANREGPQVVDAAVTVAGGTTIKSAGAKPVTYESEKHLLVFKLSREGRGWVVSFVGFLS
ncbi:DUF6318 family protein [Nocardioides sp.]|uniref:DUF6318 family protein n=1 Tax=Nocardioides sp. TaxID=35761 RepID=UPI003783B536